MNMSQMQLNKMLMSHNAWIHNDKLGQRADFTDQDLSGADMRYRNLINVIFVNSNLEKTNFTGSNMASADCTNANMREAKLIGTTLTYALFQNANMSRANFSGAALSGTGLDRVLKSHTG